MESLTLKQAVIEQASKGYTTRAIRKILADQYPELSGVPDSLLTQWILLSKEETDEQDIHH